MVWLTAATALLDRGPLKRTTKAEVSIERRESVSVLIQHLHEKRAARLKKEALPKVIEHEDRAEQLPVEFVADTAAELIAVADVPVPLLFDADEAA